MELGGADRASDSKCLYGIPIGNARIRTDRPPCSHNIARLKKEDKEIQ